MKTFSTSIGVWIQVQMLQSMVSDPSINMNPKPILYIEKVYAMATILEMVGEERGVDFDKENTVRLLLKK